MKNILIFDEESDCLLRKTQKRVETFIVNKEEILGLTHRDIGVHHSTPRTLRLCTSFTFINLESVLLLLL